MHEDPRITLLKLQLGAIAEEYTNRRQELERVEMQLYMIQQERENLNIEINNLISQAQSIEEQIHELGG